MRKLYAKAVLLALGVLTTSAASVADEALPLSVTEAPTLAVRLTQQIGPVMPETAAGDTRFAEMAGAAMVGAYLLYRGRRGRLI